MAAMIDSGGRARLFAMVTTKHSASYTDFALKTFFEHTELRSQDRFVLIDNDNGYRKQVWQAFPSVEIQENERPLSFAENVNQMLRLGGSLNADLYFLNNDIIFTRNWLNSLLTEENCLLSPIGNQQVQYRTKHFVWRNALSLEEYLQHKAEFELLTHDRKEQGFMPVLVLGFFCIKLPFSIYSQIGLFDTSYGVGGGEDTDYCLRAALANFPAKFSKASYVLHFNQRSTGAVEDEKVKREREIHYRKVFLAKWGEPLARLAIGFDQSVLEQHKVAALAAEGRYRELVLSLLQVAGKPVPSVRIG